MNVAKLAAICTLSIVQFPVSAIAAPSVPGFDVVLYASGLNRPGKMVFDAVGNLYLGGGAEETGLHPIQRVGPGGSPVGQYGVSQLADPDSVEFDVTGGISGTPGAVLVSGGAGPGGTLYAIFPNESVGTVWQNGPVVNMNEIRFDSTGRLWVAGLDGKLGFSTGGLPTVVVSLSSPITTFAFDSADRIFTLSDDGHIRIFLQDGTLVDNAFATGVGAPRGKQFQFGPGGVWGSDLYLAFSGDLVKFDSLGNSTVVGTAFQSTITFGLDGALYSSDSFTGEVYRITPQPPVIPEPSALISALVALLLLTCHRTRRATFGRRQGTDFHS